VGVTVPLDNLVGHRRHFEAQVPADPLFDRGWHRGVGAHGSGNLAHPDALYGFNQPGPLPAQLLPPNRQLKPKGYGLGVHAVGAAHHDRVLMLDGLVTQGL